MTDGVAIAWATSSLPLSSKRRRLPPSAVDVHVVDAAISRNDDALARSAGQGEADARVQLQVAYMQDLGAVVVHGEDDALQVNQLLWGGVHQRAEADRLLGLGSGQRIATILGYQDFVGHSGVLGEVHHRVGQAHNGGNGEQGEEGGDDGNPLEESAIALAGLQLLQHLAQLDQVHLAVLVLVNGL